MTEATGGLTSELRLRLRAGRPPGWLWIAGAGVWGAAMTVSALFSLVLLARLPEAHIEALVALYFVGGGLSWIAVLPIIRFCAFRRPRETRFAAAFLFLGAGTVAMTAFVFAMQYRLFYAQWHAPFGTVTWAFQFVFTSAGAVYQFAVLGLRLAFPLALVFLIAASLYLARASR